MNTTAAETKTTFNPETVKDLIEKINEYSERPLYMRGAMCRFIRFQESIGNLPSDVADAAIWHVAVGDAEDATPFDPFIAMIDAERNDNARKHGMWIDCPQELLLDFDRLPGDREISRKWCQRLDDMIALHLDAWEEYDLAERARTDPDSFKNSYDLLGQYTRNPSPSLESGAV